MKKVLQEPLLHFLIMGVAFFVLYSAVNPGNGSDKRIVVDDGRINNLVAVFEKTWNRMPTETELNGLIDDFVLEEIYYREALAMGIDKNDAMIRRRLRQKMEFFANAANALVEPEEEELEQYLRDNQARYKTDNIYSFKHIYISTDATAAELEQKVTRIQAALARGEEVKGDQTLLSTSFSDVSAFELNRSFGANFTQQLDNLTLNQWSEPVRSGLGLHIIKLQRLKVGTLPVLATVRDAVMRDWMYERTETLRDKIEQQLLEQYQVVVTGGDRAMRRDDGA